MIEARINGDERMVDLAEAQQLSEDGHFVELRDGNGEWVEIERIAPRPVMRDGILGI